MFIAGVLLVVVPITIELTSYRADDEAYADIAQQFRPPGTLPPSAIPMPIKTPESAVCSENNESSPEPHQTADIRHFEKFPERVTVNQSEQPSVPTPGYSAPFIQAAEPSAVHAETIVGKASGKNRPDHSREPASCTPLPQSPLSPTITPEPGIDHAACLAENGDYVAWLTIPGTKIDYPVVRSNRTSYYLTHLFSGKESKLGSLFSLTSSDYRSPSKNIAIYGHHLSNSSAMFSTLLKYKSASYCAGHSQIKLDSLYGKRTYEIFAVVNMLVSDWDAATASFASRDAFMAFVNCAKAQALFNTGVEVNASDHILTLITCDRSYGGRDGRLVVMAVQKE